MKKLRLFLNPIEGRRNWLNKLGKEGYRLKSITAASTVYEFDKSNDSYEYAVQYIGYMSNKERKEYESFLRDAGYSYWNVALNIGQVSVGRVKWRPYADIQGQIATSPGMINKEILIIERPLDGKPFRVFSDIDSSIQDLRRRRRSYIYLTFMLLIFTAISLTSCEGYHLTGWVYRPDTPHYAIWILLAIGFLYSILFIVFLTRELSCLKQESELHE